MLDHHGKARKGHGGYPENIQRSLRVLVLKTRTGISVFYYFFTNLQILAPKIFRRRTRAPSAYARTVGVREPRHKTWYCYECYGIISFSISPPQAENFVVLERILHRFDRFLLFKSECFRNKSRFSEFPFRFQKPEKSSNFPVFWK